MLSVRYASKNAYSAGKTSGVLRSDALGANRCYVLAHCGGGGKWPKVNLNDYFSATECLIDLKPSYIFKFVRSLEL